MKPSRSDLAFASFLAYCPRGDTTEIKRAQSFMRALKVNRVVRSTSGGNETAATLDVAYPLIHRTIDVRLHRTVKSREKWLEFLLGATPKFEEYSFDEEPPEPLPDALAASLAIDLRPRLGSVGSIPGGKP